MSAALVAAYWLRAALPCATRLPISTTRPSRAAAIAGSTTFAMRAIDSTCRRHINSPSDASQLAERPYAQHARGVDERVDAFGASRRRFGRGAVAQVDAHRGESIVRDRRRRDVEPDDAPTVGEQRLRDRRADAGARAGDDGALSFSLSLAWPLGSLGSVSFIAMRIRRIASPLGTDVGLLDDLRRLRRVVLLEADEVVDRSRREQQALLA